MGQRDEMEEEALEIQMQETGDTNAGETPYCWLDLEMEEQDETGMQ